jgi:hypothetical protein
MLATLTLDTSVDTTKTTAIQVPEWARFGMVYQPAHTDGALSMEVCLAEDIVAGDTAGDLLASDDTYWAAVANNSESVQIAGSGALEANWIDISDYIQSLPKDCYIRFVIGAAETGGSALTFKVVFRGA